MKLCVNPNRVAQKSKEQQNNYGARIFPFSFKPFKGFQDSKERTYGFLAADYSMQEAQYDLTAQKADAFQTGLSVLKYGGYSNNERRNKPRPKARKKPKTTNTAKVRPNDSRYLDSLVASLVI